MYLSMKNVNFGYTKTEPILSDFSLDIKKGEITALLGKSGSGKSTILRLISGLEKPETGKISVNQKILCDNKNCLCPEKRNVGMVFQDYALFPHLNVYKNIKFGLKHLSKPEQEQRIKEVLELVNLEHKENQYPHELSGGEMQRIALARSLATKPDILLLDEPFSNLDAELKEEIRENLKGILEKADITCLFVTHDIEDANHIADTVIKL